MIRINVICWKQSHITGLIVDTLIWNVKYINQQKMLEMLCPRLLMNVFMVIFARDFVVVFEPNLKEDGIVTLCFYIWTKRWSWNTPFYGGNLKNMMYSEKKWVKVALKVVFRISSYLVYFSAVVPFISVRFNQWLESVVDLSMGNFSAFDFFFIFILWLWWISDNYDWIISSAILGHLNLLLNNLFPMMIIYSFKRPFVRCLRYKALYIIINSDRYSFVPSFWSKHNKNLIHFYFT